MTQTTSGIEPLFMAFYKRKKKDENGTIIDVVGDKFVEYFVIHQPFKDWLVLNNLKHDTIE
jgi:ribonucleoside-diphosphate reductase alpha chain